jgi:hypothetical protein
MNPMTRWILSAVLAVALFGGVEPWAGSAPAVQAPALSSPMVSEEILSRFEKDVNDLAIELNHRAARRKEMNRQGEQLQGNVEQLRSETQAHPNMLKEVRIRNLLGELKSNLEQRAEEERRVEEIRRTFEEQVLSLTVLYNDRIESLLGEFKSLGKGPWPERSIIEILGVIGRREMIQRKAEGIRHEAQQRGIDRYPRLFDVSTMDHENLLLAKGFLGDREAQLSEQIERISLEMMEIHRQIKLEARIRLTIGKALDIQNKDTMAQNGLSVLAQQGAQGKARLLYLSHDLARYQALLTKTRLYLKNVDKKLKATQGKNSGKLPLTM